MYGTGTTVIGRTGTATGITIAATQLPRTGIDLAFVGGIALVLLVLGFVLLRVATRATAA